MLSKQMYLRFNYPYRSLSILNPIMLKLINYDEQFSPEMKSLTLPLDQSEQQQQSDITSV